MLNTNKDLITKNILMKYQSKARALSIQMFLTRLKYSKCKPDTKVNVTSSKMLVSMERFRYQKCSCEIFKPCDKLFNIFCMILFLLKADQTPKNKSKSHNYWHPRRGIVSQNTHVKYQSSRVHSLKVICNVKIFFKKGQVPRSTSLGQKCKSTNNGILTRNNNQQGFNTHCSKVITKVQVFKKQINYKSYKPCKLYNPI